MEDESSEALKRALANLTSDSRKYRVADRLPKEKRPLSLMISFGLADPEESEDTEQTDLGEGLEDDEEYEDDDEADERV